MQSVSSDWVESGVYKVLIPPTLIVVLADLTVLNL